MPTETSGSGGVTIGVLGHFEVSVDEQPVRLTAGRLRALLAVLALSAGKTVSMERLAQAVWSNRPPQNVRRSLQNYAGRLRDALGMGLVETRGSGLVLHVDVESVDALRFNRMVEHAGDGPWWEERERLAAALGLWRGEPFEGLDSRWLAEVEGPRLTEQYLVALERQVDLELADGRHRELVADLEECVARHPTRETLWLRLLMALDRGGRQAEALQRYEQVRQRLADDLGTDPGPSLRRAYEDLLAGRRLSPGTGLPPTEPAERVTVPRQLPSDIDGFVGREPALELLSGLALEPSEKGFASLAVVTGTAGVGKTALAVRWAHSVADQFPDGQIYLDLRGFGPVDKPMAPPEGMRALLAALGIRPEDVPHGLDAQIGLYRTLTVGRRLLLVLDNARDADQVRPLLPARWGCRVVVTSRNHLGGLVATESAMPITLDVLSTEEARRLLTSRTSVATDHDPATLDALGELCARLPLALVIVAARLVSRPDRPAGLLAAELGASEDRLDPFDAGDPRTDIRAVLSWSYRVLSPGAARMFRLFGSCRLRALSVSAAASLAGHTVRQAGRLLAELCRVCLVTEVGARYSSHDLLHAYAGELAALHDSPQDRAAAASRLVEHYLRTAHQATLLIDPHRSADVVEEGADGVVDADLDGRAGGQGWFEAERAMLPSLLELAADNGLDAQLGRLSWAFTSFLDRSGRWLEWAGAQQAALAAARRLDDRTGEAKAHGGLGRALTRLGRYRDAHTHLTRAAELFTDLDDRTGMAITEVNLGWMHECQGEFAEATGPLRSAIASFLELGHTFGQARASNALGWCLAHDGAATDGLRHCREALALQQGLDDRFGQAETWNSLGYIHGRLGELAEAVHDHRRAYDIYGELGDRHNQAETLTLLGDIHRRAGNDQDALRCARRATEIADELARFGVELP